MQEVQFLSQFLKSNRPSQQEVSCLYLFIVIRVIQVLLATPDNGPILMLCVSYQLLLCKTLIWGCSSMYTRWKGPHQKSSFETLKVPTWVAAMVKFW